MRLKLFNKNLLYSHAFAYSSSMSEWNRQFFLNPDLHCRTPTKTYQTYSFVVHWCGNLISPQILSNQISTIWKQKENQISFNRNFYDPKNDITRVSSAQITDQSKPQWKGLVDLKRQSDQAHSIVRVNSDMSFKSYEVLSTIISYNYSLMAFFDAFWDGKSMNYPTAYASTYGKVIGMFSGFAYFFCIVFCFVIYLIQRNHRKNYRQSLLHDAYRDTLLPVEDFKDPKTTTLVCVIFDVVNVVLFWIGTCMLSLSIPISSSFDIIPSFVAGILLFVTFLAGLAYQIWRQSQHHAGAIIQERLLKGIIKFKYLLIGEVIILLSASILLPLLFDKGCLCVFNSGYGIPTFMDLTFSTKWTRNHWIPDSVCKDGAVCHIYATLPKNAATEVFINLHTGTDIKQIELELDGKKFPCQFFRFPSEVEERGQRHLFTCYAQGLDSRREYNLKVLTGATVLKEHKYRTMPSKLDPYPFTLFFGGDWGYLQSGIDIVKTVSKVNPDAILIGGDVGYDNGIKHCYYSWDLLLETFEQQFTQIGRLIPFIFSVGNHDVGYNDNANYNITVSEEEGPYYFSFFPQSTNDDMSQAANIEDRKTFNIHLIKGLALFGLDSGYLYPRIGKQSEWLAQELDNLQDYRKIAHYHVPLYPTCFNNASFMGDWVQVIQSQKDWVPIFDKYGFAAAFENHVHQFKRSYPLKNNSRSERGTVYFGDGSMGVKSKKCSENDQTYGPEKAFDGLFETVLVEQSDHFWVMVDDGETLKFEAFTPEYKSINGSNYIIQKEDL